MNHWIAYSLAASFCWGIANILDTVILGRYKLSPWIYFALDGLLGIFPVIFFTYLSPFSISEKSILFSVVSGIFVAIFYILYFSSLNLTDISVVVILIQITPVFSLIWGVLLLKDQYIPINYAGMCLILLGTIIASISETRQKKSNNIPKSIIAFGLMLIAAFSLSVAYLFQKIALNQDANFIMVFVWQRTSILVISLIIFLKFHKEIFSLPYQPVALTFLVETISTLSKVTFYSSLQPVWVLILLWVFQILKINSIPRSSNIPAIKVMFACGLVVLGLFLLGR
jgi:drug/metabolite transporter (DMT)-like permease